MSPECTVRYTVTRADYREFVRLSLGSNPLFRRLMLALRIIGPVFLFLRFWDLVTPLLAAGLAIVFGQWIITVALRIAVWAAGRIPRENGGVLGEHVVTLREDGLMEETAINRTALTWFAISDIIEQPQHIVLMIDHSMGIIIPKRSFDSPANAQQFLANAVRLWKSAGPALPQSLS